MAHYKIVFARSARKELLSLPPIIAERIISKVEVLAHNPRPPGSKKLRGPSRLWRLRIGEYRVVYDIDDENRILDISVVRHRNEAYR